MATMFQIEVFSPNDVMNLLVSVLGKVFQLGAVFGVSRGRFRDIGVVTALSDCHSTTARPQRRGVLHRDGQTLRCHRFGLA